MLNLLFREETNSNLDRSLGNPDLQISSLVGIFKKKNVFLVYAICFYETVHAKWCLHKAVW